ncbi:hypothetical protein CHU98_g6298 [Xylaria longipes]|nr:hypothetical protein CHU98_g6298 [Xylaria longipes]
MHAEDMKPRFGNWVTETGCGTIPDPIYLETGIPDNGQKAAQQRSYEAQQLKPTRISFQHLRAENGWRSDWVIWVGMSWSLPATEPIMCRLVTDTAVVHGV